MWLATGLFACSQSLLKELMMFLRTRRHPISQDSIHRLQKTLRNGPRCVTHFQYRWFYSLYILNPFFLHSLI